MGHRNIAELTHAFSKIRAEVNDLKNIKAEVDYKDLGVDDGTTAREEENLLSGAVMKAIVQPGQGGESPESGSLVYLHVNIMNEQENEIIFTTRKEKGGSGEPCLYIVGRGNSRPLRGIEIALMSMTQGERNIVLMKSEMCLMHQDIENSSMAHHIKGYQGLVNEQGVYKADIELVDWKRPHLDSVPYSSRDHVFKYILEEGEGWETPRKPFTISIRVCGRPLSYAANCLDRDAHFPETSITCEVGDGTLPEELELGICTMRKAERAIILTPVLSTHPMIHFSQCQQENDQIKPMQIKYIEYEVVLDDLTQARDILGDGKSIKRIIRKGEGEFPIDCPMEDTNVTIKAKIRNKGQTNWFPFLSSDTEDTITLSTGMGELPDVIDAALRVMLKKEVSLLSTVVDPKLSTFFPHALATAFPEGEQIEIEVELIEFTSALPIAALPPKEKLQRAKQMKSEGNELYKQGKISLAKSKYKKALTCLGKGYEFSEEDSYLATEVKVSCMLNLAACAQKDGAFGDAISWCEKVLGEHPDNTKAYFRRSKARQGMALFHEALEDLDAMLEIDPNLRVEAQRERAILIKKSKEASNKQKKEFRSFFAK